MPKTPGVKLDYRLARRCRNLVFRTAKKYKVPPVLITAHVRSNAADAARLEVWNIMINELGLRRHQVAKMFGRDVRRLRASVLEKRRPI